MALLSSVAGISGLSLDTTALELSAQEIRAQVDAQIEGSDEVTAVVRALEVQYDAYLAGAQRSLLAEMGGSLPTADELGEELERYLAQQSTRVGTGKHGIGVGKVLADVAQGGSAEHRVDDRVQ